MRHVGLIAFGVTTALLVPAALHQLSAGREQRAKLVAPDASSMTLADGTAIDAALDHGLVDPGDAIHLTLTAHGAAKHRVAVGVVVLGSTGDEGSRVPSPPVGVAHQTVSLDVGDDGTATKQLAFRLRNATPGYDVFAHYTVLVMTPDAADKIDRLRRNARLIGGTKDDPIPTYNKSAQQLMSALWATRRTVNEGEDDEAMYTQGHVARLEAHARPINAALTITTPDTARVGEPFTVAVTLKNPGKRKLTGVSLSLEPLGGLLGDGVHTAYHGVEGEALQVSDAPAAFDLAGHETRRVEFQVTGATLGVIGLYARARCEDDWAALGNLGAVDATELVEATTLTAER